VPSCPANQRTPPSAALARRPPYHSTGPDPSPIDSSPTPPACARESTTPTPAATSCRRRRPARRHGRPTAARTRSRTSSTTKNATTSRYAPPLRNVPPFSDIRRSVPPQTLSGRHPHDARWHALARPRRARRLRFVAALPDLLQRLWPAQSPTARGHGLHFTASRRQKHRRWAALDFTGLEHRESGVWTGPTGIALHVLYYSSLFPLFLRLFNVFCSDRRTDGRNGRLVSFNFISYSATCFHTAP
jgi:hypothetical protein